MKGIGLLATMFATMFDNSSKHKKNNDESSSLNSRDGKVVLAISPEAMKVKQENINIQRGLKKFTYGDKYLFALNQKNADIKAKKLKYI